MGNEGPLVLLRRGLLVLKARREARRSFAFLGSLGNNALKDIGLSRSDLLAVRKGLIFGDNTRRKR